jgi:hypothetical protein
MALWAIEDLFEEAYYLGHVNSAYSKELKGKSVMMPAKPPGSIVDRLTAHCAVSPIVFNKGRVAKLIMADLGTKKAADLAEPTVEAFRKAFASIDAVLARWAKQ